MKPSDPDDQLRGALASGRVHSAYLLSGPGTAPREAALRFVRGLVCEARDGERPCERCLSCRRSAPKDPVALDGVGKRGPLYRHVGDHPDLLWIERGADDTRVRIGQVRALQERLRLRASEGGSRAAVIADAEWLNQEAQNALLRLLEEPPPRTTLVIVATSAAGLLATLRSRCQRLVWRAPTRGLDEDPEARALATRLAGIGRLELPALLDWAEEYRGARADAAAAVTAMLHTASLWLRDRVAARAGEGVGGPDLEREVDAFRQLQGCRKALAQRNANPQMVAERALLVLHEVLR
jgi:DNA polymerase III delta prime subunit